MEYLTVKVNRMTNESQNICILFPNNSTIEQKIGAQGKDQGKYGAKEILS
jgi:hypothetical protein